jgi:hypothetical protein
MLFSSPLLMKHTSVATPSILLSWSPAFHKVSILRLEGKEITANQPAPRAEK